MENRNVEMAKYIWSILKQDLTVMMSWGIDKETVKPVELGIEFHVQGFIHTGIVRIVLNEGQDLFEVYLISDAGEIKRAIKEVYLDMLLKVIDEAVEKTENYQQRICQEYGFIPVSEE